MMAKRVGQVGPKVVVDVSMRTAVLETDHVTDCRQWQKFRITWPAIRQAGRDELVGMYPRIREDDFLLNLSDGGHHENLGVYELIKRRCEVIVASDAAADPGFNFGDIANLMRKVRIDLGVEIDIDLKQLRQNEHQNTKAHHAIGTIEYPDGKEGILVYIKTSLTGDEPEDLLAYRRKHKTFPDESTADQFFNEPQFESYRELGYLIGRQVFS